MSNIEIARRILELALEDQEWSDSVSKTLGVEGFGTPTGNDYKFLDLALDILGVPKDDRGPDFVPTHEFRVDPNATYCRDWINEEYPSSREGLPAFMAFLEEEVLPDLTKYGR